MSITKTVKSLFICIFFFLYTVPSISDYIAGEEANRKGDRETAFKEFYAAANDSDKRAYGKLASMYMYGLGTEKDYYRAYIWFQMSHLSGEKQAERFRDAASSMMSREDYLQAIDAAEDLSRKLNPGN